MAARHGHIAEFNNSKEDWLIYVERVNLYLTANGKTNEGKERAVLLSVCGTKTYHTIVAPNKLTDIGYDDIVKLVQEHYNPKLAVTMQWFKDPEVRRIGSDICGSPIASGHSLQV